MLTKYVAVLHNSSIPMSGAVYSIYKDLQVSIKYFDRLSPLKGNP